jgi:DNA ligase-1
MHAFALLVEELESRPDDADRVAALARYLRAAGPATGELAGRWLVAGAAPVRPPRLPIAALTAAAAALAAQAGMPAWLFEAGRAASADAAEAVAALLPWPHEAAPQAPAAPPALAAWLADWRAAASAADPVDRARAVAAAIAALDDAVARRWAVRAAAGLVRPLVAPWQWQRAWARAFGGDPQALAWAWRQERRLAAAAGAAPLAVAPRPSVAPRTAASDELDALLAAWRAGHAWGEPRWPGVRVQLVRRGGAIALWRHAGGLLEGASIDALLAAADWPDPAAIDAVLVGWLAGRPAPVAAVEAVLAAAARAGARRAAAGPSLHLALVDWHLEDAAGAADRRARLLARWPAHGPGPGPAGGTPPPVFASAALAAGDALAAPGRAHPLLDAAEALRRAGWSGLVLRMARGGPDAAPGEAAAAAEAVLGTPAWAVLAPPRRVRAVLQYVPSEALAATGAALLAEAPCGFALWNRAPLSREEQHAAMTASMSGEFLPAPAGGALPGLRLLPLARVPLALPEAPLRAIHAWLRANAGARFGGQHAVAPALVFEIGHDAVRPSRRHRLGAVLEGARVLRWLADAPAGAAQRADELEDE